MENKTTLEVLQETLDIQCLPGNWDFDPYMMGLANGLILAKHIMTEAEGDPDYKEAPYQWRGDIKKPKQDTDNVDNEQSTTDSSK